MRGALITAAAWQDTLAISADALGVGVVTILAAAVVAGPVLARAVVGGLGAAFPPLSGAIGQLARGNAVRNPRRTGATAGALMIGLGMIGATAVLAASLDTSITASVATSFGADYVVSAGGGQPIPADTVAQVRALPRVTDLTRQRYGYALAHQQRWGRLNGFVRRRPARCDPTDRDARRTRRTRHASVTDR